MKWISEHKLVLSVFGAFMALLIFHYISSEKKAENLGVTAKEFAVSDMEDGEEKEKEKEMETSEIFVDVKGAVNNPGMYEAKLGERVMDIIERANGFAENAAQDAVNLAERLKDEMVVYVPKEGEDQVKAVGEQERGALININEASATELLTLPGIGEAKAAAIIDYREQNSGFKEKEELKEISGIGEKTFEKLMDLITVD